jgi:hypothetical protein
MSEYIISCEYDGRKRKLFEKRCFRCNKSFYYPKHTERKYCGRLCASESLIKGKTIKCFSCDKECHKSPSKLRISKFNFCSRKCKDFAQSLRGNCPGIRPKHYGSKLQYKGRINLDKCIGCGESRRFLLMTHHIDGDRTHNEESNLECVCHNCHVIRHVYSKNGIWIYSTRVLTDRELLKQFYVDIAHSGERRTCNSEAVGA